jgi:nitroreductase
MQFPDVVRKRRMVRHFTSDQVDPSTITRILQLALHAPSAGFTQGQSFVVVTRPDLKKRIAQLAGEDEYVSSGFHSFISEAPVLIVPCTSESAYHRRYQEPDKINEDGSEIAWPVPYWYMDVGCSVMIVLLAAVNEGLAAGFAGIPAPQFQDFCALLRLPQDVVPVGVIPVGHPAPDVPSPSLKRGRKPRREVIHYEQWGGTGAD